MELSSSAVIGVAGAGAMGMGIAQIAAQSGHEVRLYDTRAEALEKAIDGLRSTFQKLSEKGKITSDQAKEASARIHPVTTVENFSSCDLIIEAIIEELFAKQSLFREIEGAVKPTCILASNTSSLSITSIAGQMKEPSRTIGLHFFNPAPLMPLVEVIPAMQTNPAITDTCFKLMQAWKKIPVKTKDTPGFIVNRVARPFYGEALRICEEQIADAATIDEAMRSLGNFRMGPFELMDLIGNDINYAVTETVWNQFYNDPRYRPNIIQKRMVESGRLGRKSGRGYYSYNGTDVKPEPSSDKQLHQQIFERILVMLINEAAEALYYKIASAEDIDLAMTKGVNYPKGLLQWADEYGIDKTVKQLDTLYNSYHEDRYRASVLLRKMNDSGKRFYN